MYQDIFRNLGLKIPENSKLYGEHLLKWQEAEVIRLLFPLIAQAYIGCHQTFGITEEEAARQFQELIEANKRKRFEKSIKIIPVAIASISGFVNSTPSLESLVSLGLLRVMPISNICQADQRHSILRHVIIDPVSTYIYHKNPRFFTHRCSITDNDPILLTRILTNATPVSMFINSWYNNNK